MGNEKTNKRRHNTLRGAGEENETPFCEVSAARFFHLLRYRYRYKVARKEIKIGVEREGNLSSDPRLNKAILFCSSFFRVLFHLFFFFYFYFFSGMVERFFQLIKSTLLACFKSTLQIKTSTIYTLKNIHNFWVSPSVRMFFFICLLFLFSFVDPEEPWDHRLSGFQSSVKACKVDLPRN